MRRLIALSAFLGLFAAISFVTTNRIESYNRLHGGISLFSSYKEFSGLFAKQDSDTSACITKCMNNSDDTCKRDKECCSMACDAKGTNNDNGYWSGVQRCGDGKITRPREQCEKNKDCTAGKTCKNCKCIEEDEEDEEEDEDEEDEEDEDEDEEDEIDEEDEDYIDDEEWDEEEEEEEEWDEEEEDDSNVVEREPVVSTNCRNANPVVKTRMQRSGQCRVHRVSRRILKGE